MSEEVNGQFQLGQLSGQLIGINTQLTGLNNTLVSHTAEDARHFGGMEKRVDELNGKFMFWTGVAAILSPVILLVGQAVVTHYFK